MICWIQLTCQTNRPPVDVRTCSRFEPSQNCSHKTINKTSGSFRHDNHSAAARLMESRACLKYVRERKKGPADRGLCRCSAERLGLLCFQFISHSLFLKILWLLWPLLKTKTGNEGKRDGKGPGLEPGTASCLQTDDV